MRFLSAIKHAMRCLIFCSINVSLDKIEFEFSGSNVIANLSKLAD